MTRRPRRLTEEDRALWDRVRSTARPLHPERHDPAIDVGAEPAATPPEAPREPPVERGSQRPGRRVGSDAGHDWRAGDTRPAPVGRPEPGLDRRTAERLRRGTRAPDARIDLHGLSVARAHARLDGFIAGALRSGHRCVLVITGKGGRAGMHDEAPFMRPESGVLRQAAPRWLLSGPHSARIVGIYEAHLRHGGAGAFYVYLKKGR